MEKDFSKILFLTLGITFLLLPLLVSAAGLVPCGGPEGPECNVCHLLVLLQNVIKFGIQMASLVVIGSIVYGGFRWILSGGNQAQIQAGQKAIMGAIIGFIIILSAWLIVNTVFWLIAQAGGSDEYTGNWYKIECDTSSALPSANGDGDNNSGDDGGGGDGGDGGNNPPSQTGDSCRSIMDGHGYDCHLESNCEQAHHSVRDFGDCPDGWKCCYPEEGTTDPPFPTTTTTTTPPTGCIGGADKVVYTDIGECRVSCSSYTYEDALKTVYCASSIIEMCPEEYNEFFHECSNPNGKDICLSIIKECHECSKQEGCTRLDWHSFGSCSQSNMYRRAVGNITEKIDTTCPCTDQYPYNNRRCKAVGIDCSSN